MISRDRSNRHNEHVLFEPNHGTICSHLTEGEGVKGFVEGMIGRVR